MTQAAVVRFLIENVYEGGPTIVTTPKAIIPLPPPPHRLRTTEKWEYEHVFAYTGTGRMSGDAVYLVEIIESSAPELVGMTFEFGL